MKTKILILIISLLFTISLKADESYIDYTNQTFKFKAYIPVGWTKSEFDLKYKHVIKLKKGKTTEITITATEYSKDELDKWNNWRLWYTDKIGKNIWVITETENSHQEKNLTGKLIVFQYDAGCGKILQRILISKTNNFIYVVECRSPLNLFKNYTDTFNTVMGSIKSND
jgi:hypothetical protein